MVKEMARQAMVWLTDLNMRQRVLKLLVNLGACQVYVYREIVRPNGNENQCDP